MLKIKYSEQNKVLSNEIEKIHQDMHDFKSAGNDFLGWLEQPKNISYQDDLIKTAKDLADCDVMLVLGIGGSYLGTKMAYEFLRAEFSEEKLFFAGWNLSESYTKNLKEKLKGKKVALLTISKSGSTLETKKAMEYFLDIAHKHVVITGENSQLWNLAVENNWEKYTLEDNIGGRYSFLTAVSLLPLAFVGIDIKEIIKGQVKAMEDLSKPNNLAYEYASQRYSLSKNYPVELYVVFEPKHLHLVEWIKQLFGESEGKEGKGLFPASALFSTDLHSLGQFIQEGTPCLFETFIRFNKTNGMEEYNELVYNAAKNAHINGGKKVNQIELEKEDAFSLGYITYFFFKAAAMSSYLFGVNPFNQPGVEAYKAEMKRLGNK